MAAYLVHLGDGLCPAQQVLQCIVCIHVQNSIFYDLQLPVDFFGLVSWNRTRRLGRRFETPASLVHTCKREQAGHHHVNLLPSAREGSSVRRKGAAYRCLPHFFSKRCAMPAATIGCRCAVMVAQRKRLLPQTLLPCWESCCCHAMMVALNVNSCMPYPTAHSHPPIQYRFVLLR